MKDAPKYKWKHLDLNKQILFVTNSMLVENDTMCDVPATNTNSSFYNI